MPTNVIMPALGVAQEKGTLINWLKSEGQTVSKGEPLMEVETDKATVEIEAVASGILANVTASAGDEVPVGHTIALILAPGETIPERATAPSSSSVKEMSPQASAESKLEDRTETRNSTPRIPGSRILASPAAKRIAREEGIDLGALNGSGPEGSVLIADVRRAKEKPTLEPEIAQRVSRLVPLSPMRRIVGERMTQSKQSAPHFYISMDIDMTAIVGMRNRWKQRGERTLPSINDFILSACAITLKNFPVLNARFTHDGIEFLPEINIGMAVALEEGLVVPVIRNADRLSLGDLMQQSRQLSEKAQHKKLLPIDYEGGTFTVSNLGMLGVDNFVAIINPPQCAILAVGRVAPRAVADDVGIAVRSMMTATLSADHRIVDGAIAARFLADFKRRMENPDR
ncbi:MAG TPA: dihydrolipoamide acetyltransferase family protein [Candidatus Binatia bacterium]|nr:dihydrolipoamide acetyltransferase family protein [Candidatus Binatia bacterium]